MIWEQMLKGEDVKTNRNENYKSEHSAAIVAVDRQGNMVALIHSINTVTWGSNGLFVDGISIPDPATFHQELIEKVGSGQRLPEATNPGIVIKDGKPILGFSCIGSGLHSQSLTSLLNVLDFSMTLKEVSETPSIEPLHATQDSLILYIEPNRFTDDFKTEVSKPGVHLRESTLVNSGTWSGIYRDIKSRELIGTEVSVK